MAQNLSLDCINPYKRANLEGQKKQEFGQNSTVFGKMTLFFSNCFTKGALKGKWTHFWTPMMNIQRQNKRMGPF